jgi:hypothetical protein
MTKVSQISIGCLRSKLCSEILIEKKKTDTRHKLKKKTNYERHREPEEKVVIIFIICGLFNVTVSSNRERPF